MSITCSQCQHRNPKDAKFCKECGLRLTRTADPLIGQQIGNHRLVKRIGVGGMGVVYLAEHINLGKKYAVKFLHPQFASDEEVVERFRREAQVIAGLDHENIIRENDFGWLDGVGFYLIMEYLEGETLKELIRREEHIELSRVIALFAQLMDALDEAHNQSVIHRDLKPENIFLVQRRGREQLKILDFGIARVVLDGAHKDFTVDGEVYGSPTYMSPEQARGEISKVDHRADLYAVGIILVEILTGRPPYQGSTPAEVMLAHISGLPPRLSDLAPDVRFAGGLEDIVLKALAKEPEERFQSAAEFWAELEPMLLRTGELQGEIDETIDVPAASKLPAIPSSSRVLVSRDGTPTPSGERALAEPQFSSQPSLPGAAGQVVVRGDASPAPTAEMPGQQASENSESMGYGEQALTLDQGPGWVGSPEMQHAPGPGSITDLKQVALQAPSSDTPAPNYQSNAQEDSFPQPGTSPRPLTSPVNDVRSASMIAFGEEGDEDPTTVSFLGSALPSTPPKSDPPFVPSSPPTVAQPANYYSDMLESRDKTAQQYRNPPPPTIAQPSPAFQPTTPYPPAQAPVSAPPPQPTGSRRNHELSQTQSQDLPDDPIVSPAIGFLKHPAFLGGVVGFFLLLGIWMLLPKQPNGKAPVSDAGVLTNGRPPQAPRGTVNPPPIPGPRVRREKRTRSVGPAPTSSRGPLADGMVQMKIVTIPPGADVYLVTRGKSNGKVGVTPYTARVPQGAYTKIHILKAGYRNRIIPWPATSNSSNTLTLVPAD